MNLRFWKLAGLSVMAFSLTGCPNRAKTRVADEVTPEPVQAANAAEEPNLKVGPEYKEIPELKAIYFDLDQSTLRADARQVLQANYDVLKAHADWEALVEGHCDERGTTEYNLGLGQKRAASVRQYYLTLGLPGGRVATISYGKENPVCSEHNEDCWSKNRSGVTKVRSLATKSGATTESPAATGGADATIK